MNKEGCKGIWIYVIGAIGGAISKAFGGWNSILTTLCIFMVIDYVTGMLLAIVFKKSTKTESGTLESGVGRKGIARKGTILLIVLISHRFDSIMGTDIIMDCVIMAYIINEAISIIENVGLMGIHIPKVILEVIDVLKQQKQ